MSLPRILTVLPGLTPRGGLVGLVGAGWAGTMPLLGEADLIWPGVFAMVLVAVSWLAVLVSRPSRVERRWLAPGEAGVDEVTTDLIEMRTGTWPSVATDWQDPAVEVVTATGWETRDRRHWSRSLRGTRRGVHHLGPVLVTTTDALGLARRRRLGGEAELVTLPVVVSLEPEAATTTGGEPAEGTPTDIAPPSTGGLLAREYRPGDDRRRMHWPASARTGNLMVRAEEPSETTEALILLDQRTVGGDDPDLEWRIVLAASIGSLLLGRGHRLRLLAGPGAPLPVATILDLRRVLTRIPTLPLDTMPRFPDPAREEAVVAVLAGLGIDQAAQLQGLAGPRRSATAICSEVQPEAVRLLERAGWTVVQGGSPEDPAALWSRANRGQG